MFGAHTSGERAHLFTRAHHSNSDGGGSVTKSVRW